MCQGNGGTYMRQTHPQRVSIARRGWPLVGYYACFWPLAIVNQSACSHRLSFGLVEGHWWWSRQLTIMGFWAISRALFHSWPPTALVIGGRVTNMVPLNGDKFPPCTISCKGAEPVRRGVYLYHDPWAAVSIAVQEWQEDVHYFTHVFHSSIRLMRDRFALTQRGPGEVLGILLRSQSGTSKRVGTIDVSTTTVHSFSCKVPFLIPVVEWRRGRYCHCDISIPSHPWMNWRCEPSLQSIRCMDHSTRCHCVYSRIRGELKIRGYG